MNNYANRPAVSAAMKAFKVKLLELGMVPSHQGQRSAWHRKGVGGMSVIAFNAVDPTDAEFRHPARIAVALDSGQGEIVASQVIAYPSSAKVVIERLVEISDAMRYHRTKAIEGYQPDSRLCLVDSESLYLTIQRDDPSDLVQRPIYVAHHRDEGGLDRIGQSLELHKAFGMLRSIQSRPEVEMPAMDM